MQNITETYTVNEDFFREMEEQGRDCSAGIILPDGRYVLAQSGHLRTLLELADLPETQLWEMIPKDDSALFWMIAHTDCVVTDANSTVGMVMNPEQEQTYRALTDKGIIADKYYDITNERRRAAQGAGETNSIQTPKQVL